MSDMVELSGNSPILFIRGGIFIVNSIYWTDLTLNKAEEINTYEKLIFAGGPNEVTFLYLF